MQVSINRSKLQEHTSNGMKYVVGYFLQREDCKIFEDTENNV